MEPKIKTILYGLMLAVCCYLAEACQSHSESELMLEEARRLIDVDTDSARIILAEIEPDCLSEYDHQHYVLLSACALADSSSYSDEEIACAIEYFKSRDDKDILPLAHAVSGCRNIKVRNYPAAMRDFLFAEKMARDAKDYRKAGDMLLKMRDVNDSVYNKKGVIEFGRRAYETYRQIGDSAMMAATGVDLVNEMISVKEVGEAEKIIKDIKGFEWEKASVIPYFEYKIDCIRDGLIGFGSGHQQIGVLEIGRYLYNDGFKFPDSLQFSHHQYHDMVVYFWEKGEPQKAAFLLKEAENKYQDDLVHILNSYWIDENTGRSYRYEQPSRGMLYSTFQPEVNGEIRRFEYEENILRKMETRYYRNLLIAGCSMSLIVLIVVIVLTRIWIRRQKLRQEEVAYMARELRHRLLRSQSAYFKTFASLCDNYYNSYVKDSGSAKAAREALKDIEESSRSNDLMEELEKYLNETDSGLMVRFKEQMPNLRDDEYRLFLFNAFGFSVPTISILLGEKREVVYNRRLRLRAKIKTEAPAEADLFIERLG